MAPGEYHQPSMKMPPTQFGSAQTIRSRLRKSSHESSVVPWSPVSLAIACAATSGSSSSAGLTML